MCGGHRCVRGPNIPIKNTRRERDTGDGNFRLQGSHVFRFWTDRRWGFGSPGLNGSGLWFFFRHVPSCRKGKKATVPCDVAVPCRARGAAGVRVLDAVCPAGKGAARVARRISVYRGKNRVSARFAHQETPPGAPGERGNGASPRKGRSLSRTPSAPRSPNEPFPARNGDNAPSHRRNEPLTPAKPSTLSISANAALYKPRLIAPAFCGEHRARAQAQLSAPAKGYLSTLPATSSPVIPPPQTPQADGPCSWAVRRVCALPPGTETKRSAHAPYSWGMGA